MTAAQLPLLDPGRSLFPDCAVDQNKVRPKPGQQQQKKDAPHSIVTRSKEEGKGERKKEGREEEGKRSLVKNDMEGYKMDFVLLPVFSFTVLLLAIASCFLLPAVVSPSPITLTYTPRLPFPFLLLPEFPGRREHSGTQTYTGNLIQRLCALVLLDYE